MSDAQYITAMGMIQKFKDKPVYVTRDVNGQQVTNFTIRTVGSQKLVGVSLWPEHAALVPHLCEGALVAIDGKYRVDNKDGREFFNISATQIAFVGAVPRAEREVVNQQPAAAATTETAAAAPAAATGGSPF